VTLVYSKKMDINITRIIPGYERVKENTTRLTAQCI